MGSMKKTRNRVNWYSGLILSWGLWVSAVLLDPLNVYNEEQWGGFDQFFLVAVAVMASVSVVSQVLFVRPYAARVGDRLIVQNPLWIWRIPVSSIDSFDDTYPYASVMVAGKRIRLVSTERSLRSVMQDDTRLLDNVIEIGAEDRPSKTSARRRLTCSWSLPNIGETILVLAWVAYVLAGYLASY